MIHLTGDHKKTFCGQEFNSLSCVDPGGSIIYMVTSVGGGQQNIHAEFDRMAKQANCPKCLATYFSGRAAS